MKKYNYLKLLHLLGIIIICLTVLDYTAFSQNVGINNDGTTANASAMLDVKSETKGLLIPRVELEATNLASPIVSPETSLLIYNTAIDGSGATAVTPGYYYWSGTEWLRLISGDDSNNWRTTGNTGTNPSTNFLGTIDNESLVFRTNNTERARITSNGLIGINTSTASAQLHVVEEANDGGTPGVRIVESGAGQALEIQESDGGQGIWVDESGGGNGILITEEGPGDGIQVFSDGDGNAATFMGGNVGIGTLTPSTLLEVNDGSAIKLGAAFMSSGAQTLGGNLMHLSNNAWFDGAAWNFPNSGEAGTLIQMINDDMNFFSHDGAGSFNNNLVIKGNGDVGIGTSAPTQKLDIDGQIRIRGGAPGPGKVLTSTGSDGTAAWEDPSSGGSGCSGSQVVNNNNSFTVTPGVCLVVANRTSSTSSFNVTMPNPANHAGEILSFWFERGGGSGSEFRSLSGSQLQTGTASPVSSIPITNTARQKHMFFSNGSIWVKFI